MIGMPPERTFLLLLILSITLLFGLEPVSGSSLRIEEANVTRCRENERRALLMFKGSLVDGYGILSSWGSEDEKKDCCKWRGVECSNRTGHVVKLNLQGQGEEILGGKVSPSLLELNHLNYLDLSFNDFNGSYIPEFLGSIPKLTFLDLSYAGFGGPIPHQLGNLSRLQSLNLRSNDLYSSGNLEWLALLPALHMLDISLNNLSKANDWVQVINQLPSLETLQLMSCNLPSTVFPSLSLVNSSRFLITLDLSSNNLTSSVVYPWLFNFSSLVDLDLSLNQLKGRVPEAFGNMKALAHLLLSRNQLEGQLPESFGNFCSLKSLILDNNYLSGEFSGIIQNLSGCTEQSLENLFLNNNQITGSIPEEIRRFSSLKYLELGYNRLNGNVSEGIGLVSELEDLNLHGNSFIGLITESHFSNLSKLQSLDLSYNFLTLKFSPHWIPPFQLGFIRLGSCKLGPRFPNWLQSQNHFTELDVSDAGISDSIPSWFWDLSPTLRYLNVSYNQISGSLTDLSLKFIGFPALDLRSNRLEGPLPLFPSNLTSLNLSKNMFKGAISSICKITGGNLFLLDLSDNQLSGTLPNCFEQWPHLEILNLANNKLSGRIPSSVGSLVSLEMFSLTNNSFVGGLPVSFQNCEGLKFMDLSNNKLSGEIPEWIGQSLSSLVFLSLRSNRFNGSIQSNLCGLTNLQILDLSLNEISGKMPKCLNNLTSMAQEGNLSTTIQHTYVYGDPQFGEIGPYIDKALLVWKGTMYEFLKNLGLFVVIDLSSNNLTGDIPDQITGLSGLVALNLSRNLLTGVIPPNIGQLRQLQVLDLSRNQLSSNIPASITELTFLSQLDLSHNNLSGKVPSSTQLDSFDASAFAGNLALCGPPVTTDCPGDGTSQGQQPSGNNGENQDDDEFTKWFFTGMGVGFAVGFWGICSALLLKRSWRHAYFRFLDSLKDWLDDKLLMKKARSRRNQN